jgi:DNA-binding GntR family transcriptional regulator
MTHPHQQIDFRTSAADAVTKQLRKELLDGTIPAGSRMLPREIAERFSLSLVPVREALSHLEAEGLIVTTPQRATFAAEIGLDDLAGIYDLRRIVEPELARRAAIKATEEDRQSCKAALKDLLGSPSYSSEFFLAHRSFHWRLLAPAGTMIVRNVLERLWQNVDRYFALAVRPNPRCNTAEYFGAYKAEHALLADKFLEGDGESLRQLLSDHLTETERRLCVAFNETQSARISA